VLTQRNIDISRYMLVQKLEELMKDFWVRAEVYDREVAKMEEF